MEHLASYTCKNCAHDIDFNPIAMRIPCPYCGTVYINSNPVKLEDITKWGKVLNNYSISLEKTDSNAVTINGINAFDDIDSGKVKDCFREIEEFILLLTRYGKREYVLISNAGKIETRQKKYKSLDGTNWKAVLNLDDQILFRAKDELMLKAGISRAMPGFRIAEFFDIIPGESVCIRKARLLNPAEFERNDTVFLYYQMFKETGKGSFSSNSDPGKNIYDSVTRTDAFLDIVTQMKHIADTSADGYMCHGEPMSLHLDFSVDRKGIRIGISEQSIKDAFKEPVSYIDTTKGTELTFNAYGMDNLPDSAYERVFAIATIVRFLSENNSWHLYSVYNNGEGTYIISLMYNTVQKPEYKKW